MMSYVIGSPVKCTCNPVNFDSIVPPPKKKLSVRMSEKKLTKQKLAEWASSPQDKRTWRMQRGIQDYFKQMDEPIRDSLEGGSRS